jgi:hypothetical protein
MSKKEKSKAESPVSFSKIEKPKAESPITATYDEYNIST